MNVRNVTFWLSSEWYLLGLQILQAYNLPWALPGHKISTYLCFIRSLAFPYNYSIWPCKRHLYWLVFVAFYYSLTKYLDLRKLPKQKGATKFTTNLDYYWNLTWTWLVLCKHVTILTFCVVAHLLCCLHHSNKMHMYNLLAAYATCSHHHRYPAACHAHHHHLSAQEDQDRHCRHKGGCQVIIGWLTDWLVD